MPEEKRRRSARTFLPAMARQFGCEDDRFATKESTVFALKLDGPRKTETYRQKQDSCIFGPNSEGDLRCAGKDTGGKIRSFRDLQAANLQGTSRSGAVDAPLYKVQGAARRLAAATMTLRPRRRVVRIMQTRENAREKETELYLGVSPDDGSSIRIRRRRICG